jgi:hypothetical protein
MIGNATAHIREIAEQFEIDLTEVSGSGNNGRILISDIEPLVDSQVRGINGVRYQENNANQEAYERTFSEHHEWQYIENQQSGDAVDCIDENGIRRELKFDWQSILESNQTAYIELQQGIGYRQIASGYLLTRQQADRFVIINDHTIWEFSIQDLDRMIQENILEITDDSRPLIRMVATRPGAGGNQGGFGSKGLSVPFSILDRFCTEKRINPVSRDFVWWVPNNDRWRQLIDLGDIDTSNCTCCNGDSRAYGD